MTVAVAINLPDGVVLAVDSALTLGNQQTVLKVFENGQKLFQLGEKRIGIETFGIATIGNRTIGSYLREFELLDPNHVVSQSASITDVVEELRSFFWQKYQSIIVPAIPNYDQTPIETRPLLGLVIGGFSDTAYLSEIWEIILPMQNTPNTSKLLRGQGDFGGNWFALNEPINRYEKGYDRGLINELKAYFVQLRGSSFTSQEENDISSILVKYEHQIPFPAMPLQEGIDHARFLVEMVINYHRFAIGPSIVGGKANVGLVTYKGEKFQIL